MSKNMKSLLAAALLVLALGIGSFAAKDSRASGNDLTCQQATTDGQSGGYFLAVALVTCSPPDAYPTVDVLSHATFWQYCGWVTTLCIWTDGDVYDLAGCDLCVQLFTETNQDVPLGYYMGINCRRAETITMIWPYLTNQQDRYYVTTRSDGECK